MMRRQSQQAEGLIRYVSNSKRVVSEGCWMPNGESFLRLIFGDGTYFMGFMTAAGAMNGTQGSSDYMSNIDNSPPIKLPTEFNPDT